MNAVTQVKSSIGDSPEAKCSLFRSRKARESVAKDAQEVTHWVIAYWINADLKRLRSIERTAVHASPHGLVVNDPTGSAGLDSPTSRQVPTLALQLPSGESAALSNSVFSSRRGLHHAAGTPFRLPNPLAGCATRSREGLEKAAVCRLFSRVRSCDRTFPAGRAVFAALLERHMTRGPAIPSTNPYKEFLSWP